LLIDEIEYGLEPHRISLLVSHLRKRVEASGQVFLSTHSTSVLREVRFGEVFVSRRDATGKVEVKPSATTATAPLEAKRYIRDLGEAMLTRSVLVCEGQTEIALLKGYAEGTQRQFQKFGATVIDGGGASAPAVAIHFASLGYRTALLTDSDAAMAPAFVAQLHASDIEHFQWGDGRCTEQELFLGISSILRPQLLELLAPEVGLERMLGELSSRAKMNFASLEQVSPYLNDLAALRSIGELAHKSKWIKRDYDLCFRIGAGPLATQSLLGGESLNGHLDQIFAWLGADA
jgi:hypothetical protein